MIKVYVAGPWVNKEDVRLKAELLRDQEIRVTSRWHDTTLKSNIYEAAPEIMSAEAEKDYKDILEANTLVLFNLTKSEGKATELGIALARGYDIYVVGGKQNNVFLHLPQVNHKESIEEVIKCLLT